MADLESKSQPRLIRILADPKFDVSNYVKEIYQSGDQNDLIEAKTNIQLLYDETAQQLKKNIYKHNSLFIDTARDISYLESEMYNLHQNINQGKSYLQKMENLSISGYKTPKSNEIESDFTLTILDVLDEIENAQQLVKYKDESILFQSDLYLMEEHKTGLFNITQKCHCYLLKDVFIHCSYLPSFIAQSEESRLNTSAGELSSPSEEFKKFKHYQTPRLEETNFFKYKFVSCYTLNTCAVINMKDLSLTSGSQHDTKFMHLFKLLIFPEAIIFKASNEEVKQEWLKTIDKAKKDKNFSKTNINKVILDESLINNDTSKSTYFKYILEQNKQDDDIILNKPKIATWIIDFPDEIKMCIAQRQFSLAIQFLNKLKNEIEIQKNGNVENDISRVELLKSLHEEWHCNLVRVFCEEVTGKRDGSSYDVLNFRRDKNPDSSSYVVNKMANLSSDFSNDQQPDGLGDIDSSPDIVTRDYYKGTSYESYLCHNSGFNNSAINLNAIRCLVAIGEVEKALNLFLNYHISFLIIKRLSSGGGFSSIGGPDTGFGYVNKRESNPLLLAEKSGDAFWGCIAETAWELIHSNDFFLPRNKTAVGQHFRQNADPLELEKVRSSLLAIFTVWLTKVELKRFIAYLKTNLFPMVQKNFSLLSQCLGFVRNQCSQLADPEYGLNLDVTYALDEYLNAYIKNGLEEQIELLCEASRVKIFDDRFDTYPCFDSKSALENYIKNLSGTLLNSFTLFESSENIFNSPILILTGGSNLRQNETSYELILAESSLSFLRSFTSFCQDLRNIYSAERYKLFKESLLHVFLNHLQYLTVLLKSTKFKEASKNLMVIKANVTFFLVQFVPLLNQFWSHTVGYKDDFKSLNKLSIDDLLYDAQLVTPTSISSGLLKYANNEDDHHTIDGNAITTKQAESNGAKLNFV